LWSLLLFCHPQILTAKKKATGEELVVETMSFNESIGLKMNVDDCRIAPSQAFEENAPYLASTTL
jgi:hypothetical protein